MDVDKLTYCVPIKHVCSNTECKRHKIHAPVGEVGVSVSDLWSTCSIKRHVPIRPVYEDITTHI